MKKSDIYLGTIKKCNNIYCYKKYGEKRVVGDFQLRSVGVGTTYKYVDKVYDNAVLIKINEDEYIWLDFNQYLQKESFNNFKNTYQYLNTVPITDKELFVDKDSLKPYFEKNEKERISVRKLKKIMTKNSKP